VHDGSHTAVGNIVHNFRVISRNVLKWLKHKFVSKFSDYSLGKKFWQCPWLYRYSEEVDIGT
jgi:hypothetical protein